MVWREGAIIQHFIYPETLYTHGSRNITHPISTVMIPYRRVIDMIQMYKRCTRVLEAH